MEKESFFKRYLVFVLGLYFLSAGIVFIVHSSLGTTPISSVNYVLSINTPLSLGTWTFIVNMVFILCQFGLIHGRGTRRDVLEILLQIPFSFIFSVFIDINMYLTKEVVTTNYLASMILLLFGCLIQSVGVVLEIKPNVTMMSAEGFVKYASRRFDKDFGSMKVIFDSGLVICAVIVSFIMAQHIEGVREGTVIAACITGYIVRFLSTKVMTRRRLGQVVSLIR